MILIILKFEFVDVFVLLGEYYIGFFLFLINFIYDIYKIVFSKNVLLC